jgi:hypothetical protein
MMKPHLLPMLLGLVAFSSLSSRAEEPGSGPATVTAGHWDLGGSVSFSSTTYSNDTSDKSFTFNLPLQYFVADHVSVGGNFRLNADSPASGVNTTTTSIGPIATWYFWTQGRWASYVQGFAGWRNNSRLGSRPFFGGSLGLLRFVTESWGVGPSISVNHRASTDTLLGSTDVSFALAFNLFL